LHENLWSYSVTQLYISSGPTCLLAI
jgi:hypothetical protein